MADAFAVTPIGFVRCGERYRFEAPRQGVYAQNHGVIELFDDYREGLADLADFERIWVIFVFHLNENWNLKVAPPVITPPGRRVGVFATRSPHRPNRIGMSCVELERIEGGKLFIRNFDILDHTPVLDIKPYIPAADAFPDAAAGWLDEASTKIHQVDFAPAALEKSEWIAGRGGPDLVNFCRVQLRFSPCDRKRKRVNHLGGSLWSIGCRTWRAVFELDDHHIQVSDIFSNFSTADLASDAPDRYGDLDLHRAFLAAFA